MTFRQEIDRRLLLISESSVTDEEYATLTVPALPTVTNYYEAAEAVLDLRGEIGSAKTRLNCLAVAIDNLNYKTTAYAETNIFLGADLEN